LKSGRVAGGKYDKKFGRQLMKGLRSDGLSIPEVCQLWQINRNTYYRWIEIHPEFAEAHEYGERDVLAYWHKLNRAVASGVVKGNAGVICFSMKNIEGIGWKDKVEVESNGQEQFQKINISILPAPVQALPNIIEHEEDEQDDDDS
jgi:Homeodomain-like domain-containing protein